MKKMSAKAQEIYDDVMNAASGDKKAARQALEDGEYLDKAGYTDTDQVAIEEAHDALKTA